MTAYGIDQATDCHDPALLAKLYLERYGRLRDLERERFTTVPTRPKPRRVVPPSAPISPESGDVNRFTLEVTLEQVDRQHRGAA